MGPESGTSSLHERNVLHRVGVDCRVLGPLGLRNYSALEVRASATEPLTLPDVALRATQPRGHSGLPTR